MHGFADGAAGAATCFRVLPPGVLGPAHVRDIAALVDGGRPDPAAMRATMQRHGLVPAAG